jgi:hypothetical protein
MTHRAEQRAIAMPRPFSTMVEWVNAALVVTAVTGFLYYVMAANGLAAQTWRFADARSELTALLEERNGLVAQQSALEDRAVLSALAAQEGLVPAGAVVYLVQEQSVAAR